MIGSPLDGLGEVGQFVQVRPERDQRVWLVGAALAAIGAQEALPVESDADALAVNGQVVDADLARPVGTRGCFIPHEFFVRYQIRVRKTDKQQPPA
ncbi:hypothetical protein [Azospirillum brasilense]|uniref:hypothetical protein n=1 Tax=Azospirillum brasilense TaxID=192 RepID=UPI0019667331|nr:hypothetical protein [Azospirillum brasilense]